MNMHEKENILECAADQKSNENGNYTTSRGICFGIFVELFIQLYIKGYPLIDLEASLYPR